MSNNILVTAIGSHSAKEVVNSLRNNGKDKLGKIYGCDIYPKEWHNITKEFADVFLAPQVYQEVEYKNFILNLIAEYEIRTIIPLTDIEVDFFNKNRDVFINTFVAISDKEFLKIARNKYLLNNFLIENNFSSIKTHTVLDITDASFPLIAKPKNGRSSVGIHIIEDYNHYISSTKDYQNYIFQEIINGFVCAVDVVKDYHNNITVISRKELIRSSNGAGITVEMFFDPVLTQNTKNILTKLKFSGFANLEFIQASTGYYLIDINPRFSAGIAFNSIYGYDFVKNSLLAYKGEKIEPFTRRDKMIFQKVFKEKINNGE